MDPIAAAAGIAGLAMTFDQAVDYSLAHMYT
jgi:hypothetical protein